MKYTLVAVNCRYTHSCLALFYLRQALAAHLPEARCRVLQKTINDPYYDALLDITEGEPDGLFFSVYVWNFLHIERLVRDIRQIYPDLPIILGGPEVTYGLRAGALADCTVVAGEIEGLSRSFYDDLARGQLLPEYRAAVPRDFPNPYVAEDFFGELANRSVYYESSRGCPYACTYCLSSVEQGVRRKDFDQVRAELSGILACRPKTLRFVDRTFNDRPERAIAIWRVLLAADCDTEFHFEIAPELFTEEMFAFLATVPVGRFQFEIGIQSTNPATLAAIRRKMQWDVVAANVRRLLALDTIHLHLDLILGLPDEGRKEFGRSFNDVFSLGPHAIQMGLLKLLPGTIIAEGRGSDFTACASPPYEILATRWLDHAGLGRLHRLGECVESFCNSRFFRTVMGYLRRHEADPFAMFEELLGVCLAHGFFELARNQERVSLIFSIFADRRSDAALLRELVAYDWLRCGQRSLPGHLLRGDEEAVLRRVRQSLPQNLPPYFTYRDRDEFIRRCHFLELSDLARQETGVDDRPGIVCLLPAYDPGVFSYKSVVILPME